MNVIPSENEDGQIDSNNVSAISYTEGEGEYVDTREESALFRDLESSAAQNCSKFKALLLGNSTADTTTPTASPTASAHSAPTAPA